MREQKSSDNCGKDSREDVFGCIQNDLYTVKMVTDDHRFSPPLLHQSTSEYLVTLFIWKHTICLCNGTRILQILRHLFNSPPLSLHSVVFLGVALQVTHVHKHNKWRMFDRNIGKRHFLSSLPNRIKKNRWSLLAVFIFLLFIFPDLLIVRMQDATNNTLPKLGHCYKTG